MDRYPVLHADAHQPLSATRTRSRCQRSSNHRDGLRAQCMSEAEGHTASSTSRTNRDVLWWLRRRVIASVQGFLSDGRSRAPLAIRMRPARQIIRCLPLDFKMSKSESGQKSWDWTVWQAISRRLAGWARDFPSNSENFRLPQSSANRQQQRPQSVDKPQGLR
jgi:hypothetical protein